MTDAVDPIGIALQVTSALDALGVVHTIGGSIASSMAGEPRSTIDVDIVADLTAEHVAGLVAVLQRDFYHDETALRRAVADCSSANLIHHQTSIKIDLFIAGGTPLDRQQLARSGLTSAAESCTFIRPKTSFCRSCDGIARAARSPTANGVTSSA